MGKTKKLRLSKTEKVSLGTQLEDEKFAKLKNRCKQRQRQDDDEEFVNSQLSKKILHEARQQQMEMEDEGLEACSSMDTAVPSFCFNSGADEQDVIDDDDKLEGDNFCEKIHVEEEDERAMEKFFSANPVPQRTLADIILEKIAEKRSELETQVSEAGGVHLQDINPKVKEMYEGVREVLSKYRSGKLPKAFKVIPRLRNWEQILYITDPEGWSAAAMYQATRIFASNLKENMAQRFYNLVLLPRVRDDIMEYKRLNFHLYQAVRKSLFKPGAFMKGFLIPLCESGTCTLREAIIVGSVLARNSIPILHSAAAMLKLAEMEYTGATSVFLRVLIDKKYALPYRVIDALVFHFLRFEQDFREMPVLWHQSLLTFVQRYKGDISSEQRDALLSLVRRQFHHSISPEVRRELQSAKCRDIEGSEPQEPHNSSSSVL